MLTNLGKSVRIKQNRALPIARMCAVYALLGFHCPRAASARFVPGPSSGFGFWDSPRSAKSTLPYCDNFLCRILIKLNTNRGRAIHKFIHATLCCIFTRCYEFSSRYGRIASIRSVFASSVRPMPESKPITRAISTTSPGTSTSGLARSTRFRRTFTSANSS